MFTMLKETTSKKTRGKYENCVSPNNINKDIEIIFNKQQSSVNISFGLVPTKEFT